MKVTRRDLLVWSAGAAAGLMVTPVPWKILDDVSIWSQNWPWIPQPTRDPVEIKNSACTLCPKGCGLRVRVAGGWPVGVSGSATHPVTQGALCPLGFGAHQLNWHPQRIKSVRHANQNASWAEARAAFQKACAEGPVVVLDGYPNRAASCGLESFARKNSGSYRVVPTPELRALQPYESWSGVPAASLGYDLENTRTIISFGAPLLDGWGSPGSLTRLWAERAAGMSDPQLRLIQIEPSLSRTAARAWQWIPIPAESISVLAAGLARVLVEQKLVPTHGPIPSVNLSEVAAQTGLTPSAMENLARTIAGRTPAVAIANDFNPAIAALNVLLGAVGTRGGIIRNSADIQKFAFAETDIPRARAVVLDSSVPWDFVPRTSAEVFHFAAWQGESDRADWLLPAPGFLEELTDVPTAPAFAFATYAVAPALSKPQFEVHSAAEFMVQCDGTLTSPEKTIHARCQEIFQRRAGSLYGQAITQVDKIESAQKLEEQLSNGAVWVASPSHPAKLSCALKQWPESVAPTDAPGWSAEWPAAILPPLASKLYVESKLRETPERRDA